jgi:hypothetical protein
MKLNKEQINLMIESLEELNEELSIQSKGTLFIEQWELLENLKQVKKLTIPVVVGQSEQFNCFLEDREQGLRCDNKCNDCKDYKGLSN